MTQNADEPRPAPPSLPTDPAERSWVGYQRLKNAATAAAQALPVRTAVFVVTGPPPDRDYSGLNPLEAAAAEARDWGIWSPYCPREEVDTLRSGWENSLTRVMRDNPSINWPLIVQWLTCPEPPIPHTAPENSQTWQEELLLEERLASDLAAYTDTPRSTVGLRQHLEDEGLDWRGYLDSLPGSVLAPVPFTAQRLEEAQQRLDWYRERAADRAYEIQLLDPSEHPTDDGLYRDIMAAVRAYKGGVQAVSQRDNPGGGEANDERANHLTQTDVDSLSERLVEAPQREWLTVREVSQRLGITDATVRRRLREGTLPGTRVANQYRVSNTELEVWLRNGGEVKPDPQMSDTYFQSDEFDPGF